MKKIIGLVVFLVSMFFVSLSTSYAADSFYLFGGKLIGGVGDWGRDTQYFYIDSSASEEATLIGESMDSWIYTGSIEPTPIYFKKTTYKPSSVMDIYKGAYFSETSGVLGNTKFYRSGSEILPSNNYSWTKIQLNEPVYKYYNSWYRKQTIAHEMGHAFGLAHDNREPDSIMCQTKYGNYVNKPDKMSLVGINWVY